MSDKQQKYHLEKIEKKLRKELDPERFRHTLGVMYTAAALAMCYGEDLEKAQAAGLLHDCAKCIPNDRKIKMCEKRGIEISPAEEKAPYLLHAKLGASLAKTEYGIEDEDIISAVRYHTTGREAMTMLEKIIFIADYIEPMRSKADHLPQIRQMAFKDLDLAVYMTLRDTLQYLKKGTSVKDDTTESAFRYYAGLKETEIDQDSTIGI